MPLVISIDTHKGPALHPQAPIILQGALRLLELAQPARPILLLDVGCLLDVPPRRE
jgi:hypothetical protein